MPPHPDRVRRNYTPEDFQPAPKVDPELTRTDDDDEDVVVEVEEDELSAGRD